MGTLSENINQVNSDFNAIKDKIVECGVEVADGTPTYQLRNKVTEVYNKGKQDEYDAFWDEVTHNGARESYRFAFACWGCEYIRPNRKIIPKTEGFQNMFAANTKLKAVEKQYFDLSQHPATSGNANYTFIGCSSLLIVEDIGMTAMSNYSGTYQGCSSLHTIEKLRVNENSIFSGTFQGCAALKNLIVEGPISKSGFSVAAATALTKASIESIVNALSTNTNNLVLTLSKAAVNKAFESSPGANDGSTANNNEGTVEWQTLKATRSNWDYTLL
jgi:hypothetical protein